MKIAVASDHGGLSLKNSVSQYLRQHGHEVLDFGTTTTESCDYPDFVRPAALAVANGECERGIVCCTTGIGASIVANKVRGVRCALCSNVDMASMTRHHNDANVLAMGQKYVDVENALQIAEIFITTPFDGGRHTARVEKIESCDRRS